MLKNEEISGSCGALLRSISPVTTAKKTLIQPNRISSQAVVASAGRRQRSIYANASTLPVTSSAIGK